MEDNLEATVTAAEVITESVAANPSSSGRGIGPKRPRGTRHYRGAHRRLKVVGRLAEVLGRKTQVITFVEHIYYIRAYKFSFGMYDLISVYTLSLQDGGSLPST